MQKWKFKNVLQISLKEVINKNDDPNNMIY